MFSIFLSTGYYYTINIGNCIQSIIRTSIDSVCVCNLSNTIPSLENIFINKISGKLRAPLHFSSFIGEKKTIKNLPDFPVFPPNL